MKKLRAYTPGILGFVNDDIRQMLGQSRHVRQARIIVLGTSKTDAATTLNHALRENFTFRHLDSAMGNDLDAIIKAGLADGKNTFIMPLNRWTGSPVVSFSGTGTPNVIGHLRIPDTMNLTFVPAQSRQ